MKLCNVLLLLANLEALPFQAKSMIEEISKAHFANLLKNSNALRKEKRGESSCLQIRFLDKPLDEFNIHFILHYLQQLSMSVKLASALMLLANLEALAFQVKRC